MASTTAHEADEVPVFLSRVSVALDVTDKLCEGLTCRVKTKRSLDHLVLEVTVDSLGATDYLDTAVLLDIVLSKYASVGVRVVTTNDHNSLDTKLLAYLDTIVKLLGFLKFCTTRTDDVKTTGVAIFVDYISCQLSILTIYQTARTTQETIKFVLWVDTLECVEKTTNHIVTSRGLTTR